MRCAIATPFDDLSSDQQARRLRALAHAALPEWPFDVGSLRLVSHGVNTIFHGVTPTDEVAIRVMRSWDGRSTPAELAWMAALGEADVPVSRPLPTQGGELSVLAEADGVPAPRAVTVLRWLPGAPLSDRLTPEGVFHLGETLASLHAHAASWSCPHPVPEMRGSVHGKTADLLASRETWLPEPLLDRVAQVRERLDPMLEQLHEEGPTHLVHADLHGGNVIEHEGTLAVIDFEEIRVAHPARDAAIATYYLDRTHPSMRAVLRSGYASRRPWPVPDGWLDRLIAAHIISLLADVAHMDPTDPAVGESMRQFVDVALMRLNDHLSR